MLKLFWKILKDEFGGTLAITRKTSGTVATAAAQNSNADEIEAVVNGAIEAANIANDAVTAVKLNSDVLRANYGLAQHTDGTLYIDLHATPGLEFSGGKLRVDGYGLISLSSDGVIWGRTGDMLFSSSGTTPDGFTDVSATYANKFIRVSATALSAGGADTHTHAAGSLLGPSHIHTSSSTDDGGTLQGLYSTTTGTGVNNGDQRQAHKHVFTTAASGTGAVTGTSASGDNVPVYVTLKMYQKN